MPPISGDDGKLVTAAPPLSENIALVAISKYKEAARSKVISRAYCKASAGSSSFTILQARVEKLKAAQLARKASASAGAATVSNNTASIGECMGASGGENILEDELSSCHSTAAAQVSAKALTSDAAPHNLEEHEDERLQVQGASAASDVSAPSMI
jgi:hypothetical protein